MIPDLWKAILEKEINSLGIFKNGSWCAGAIPLREKSNEESSEVKQGHQMNIHWNKELGVFLVVRNHQGLIATVVWLFGDYPALACSFQDTNFLVKLSK